MDRLTPEAAAHAARESADGRYGVLLRHGSMELGFYQPSRTDKQTPHDQDELYFIQSGHGTFSLNGERVPFEAGDALFVRAAQEHRFESFSEDFAAWVVFYGPAGGETNRKT